MNDFMNQYRSEIKQQWHGLDLTSKCTAVMVISLLVIGVMFTGIFVLSFSLVIALSLYLKPLVDKIQLRRT